MRASARSHDFDILLHLFQRDAIGIRRRLDQLLEEDDQIVDIVRLEPGKVEQSSGQRRG